MDFALRVGSNIRALRNSSGLTREAVSARGRLQQSSLALFESGNALPDLRQVVTIASILGTTPDALLSGLRWDQDRMRFEVDAPPAERG